MAEKPFDFVDVLLGDGDPVKGRRERDASLEKCLHPACWGTPTAPVAKKAKAAPAPDPRLAAVNKKLDEIIAKARGK